MAEETANENADVPGGAMSSDPTMPSLDHATTQPDSPDSDQEASSEPTKKNDDGAPPDGGYGWVCTGCVAAINGHTWGINSSYGVFLSYYLANDTYPGATPLQFAFVGGLSISCAMAVSPLSTWTVGRYGTRTTMLIGVFFEVLALIAASFSNQIWHLFLSQGVCFGVGMGFLFVASVGIVPQWFTKRRSFANGIATAGSGIGGLTYSLATGVMIPHLGIGWAFRILGIVAGAVNIVCALLIRDRNKQIGSSQIPFDHRLFKKWQYVALLGWAFMSMLGYVALLFTLPNYAYSVGLTAAQGSVVGAIFNLGQAIGRPLTGIFSDRFGRINLCAILTFFCGLFCLVVWIFAASYGVLLFFAVIGGMVAGTLWVTIAPVGAEVVGLRDLPSALSVAWLVLAVPATFAEPIALGLRRSQNPIYLHAQVFTGMMYMGAALCIWSVRAWKVGQLEMIAADSTQSSRALELTTTGVATYQPSAEAHQARSRFVLRLVKPKVV